MILNTMFNKACIQNVTIFMIHKLYETSGVRIILCMKRRAPSVTNAKVREANLDEPSGLHWNYQLSYYK